MPRLLDDLLPYMDEVKDELHGFIGFIHERAIGELPVDEVVPAALRNRTGGHV